MDMQGLNEFDNFGESSSSRSFVMADHPHSENQPTADSDGHHTPGDHNDKVPSHVTQTCKNARAGLTKEEARARRQTYALKLSARKKLKKLQDLLKIPQAESQAELQRAEAEKHLEQEIHKIEFNRKIRAARAKKRQERIEKRLAEKAQQQQQQQEQDPAEGDDDHQEQKPNVEDGQPKQRRRQRPDWELTEKELATRVRTRESNREYRKRKRELKQLALEGKPLPPRHIEARAVRRFHEEEARLQKLKEDFAQKARKIELNKEQAAARYKVKKEQAAARYKAKKEQNAPEGIITDKRLRSEQPVMTEEERAKLDEKKKAAREAYQRHKEQQRTKKFLESLAATMQGSAVTQPDQQLEDESEKKKVPRISDKIQPMVENIKKKVLALRTKKGESIDDPVRKEELEVLLPRAPKPKAKSVPRKRRSKKKQPEQEEEKEEENDTTPAVVPAVLELQTHYLKQVPRVESRLFKKPRPKVLDPGVPDLRSTTASHLAYSLMTREQRLALTLSVLDPEKEFEAYRWPVRESVLPSIPASKYLDEDARPMPNSFERKGMAFVSELTGVPKAENDYENSTSEGEDDRDDEDDEDEQDRLLEERRARKRQRREQHENERSSTLKLTAVHRFFREEVTTFAQKQYHKALQHLKPTTHPDLKIRSSQDELTLLQENAAAFSAEDTLLGVLDRIPFVIRQGALGKNPEYVVSGRKPVASDASYERGWNSVMLAATMAGVDERILKKVSYRMKTLLSHSRNVYQHESAPQNNVEDSEEDPDQDQSQGQSQSQDPSQDQDQDQDQEYLQVEEEKHQEAAYHEHIDTDEELVDLKDVFNTK
ncbi:hypothetical protein BGZ81_007522 [Podila clonocystis]|nr:hypothetical protein BGZ81_007522 [Podila clonocystis]